LNLAQFADADVLAGEQTWPLDEEMTGGGSVSLTGAGRDRRLVPASIPVGMSEYMADWFVDEDGAWIDDGGNDDTEGDNEDDEDQDQDDEMDGGGAVSGDLSDFGISAVECVDMGGGGDDDDDDDEEEDGMSINGSVLQAPSAMEGVLEKQRRKQAAMDDAEFPDEVDTPTDQSARLRFARYRALQSFRSSPWNCKENLPPQYSRIFQFENFSVTQKRILQIGSHAANMQNDVELGSRKKGIPVEVASGEASMEADDSSNKTHPLLVPNTDEFIAAGRFVEIVLRRVPQTFIHAFQRQVPVSLFSILPHEEKMSIVHYNIQRCPEYQGTIRSKDPLIFVSGHRTFRASPIFSEANLNSDKHKYERFLQPGRFAVATVLAQISFMPSPVLVFKELENGATELVATGNLASVDPDRIILKRIILTGVPVRVRKRFAVVKYMFYDPQDVRYFKPAELITKHGLRGHIKESIGTHGLFKAIFNAPIKQNDTVMLVLYKRVFPKSYMGVDISGNGAL
jgi:pre-rRNA-processing protein TSR1